MAAKAAKETLALRLSAAMTVGVGDRQCRWVGRECVVVGLVGRSTGRRDARAVGGAWRHHDETSKIDTASSDRSLSIIHCHFFLDLLVDLQVCHIAILIVEILKATFTTYTMQYCK